MPGFDEMRTYFRANFEAVQAYIHVIGDPKVWSKIAQEVHSTPNISGNKIQTYAILIAMGYGTKEARDIILPLFVANRLEQ